MSKIKARNRSFSPLSLHFLEPANDLKREHFIRSKIRRAKEHEEPEIDIEVIKKELKSIREENIVNMTANVKSLQVLLKKEGINSFYAETAKDASKYIENVLNDSGLNKICINNSTSVREALSEIDKGIEIIDTYNAQFQKPQEIKPINFWELPEISDNQIWNSFNIFDYRCKGHSDFIALLGVNAVSSENGSFFFVQHFKNISNLIEHAKKTILVISIEKLVKSYEQALLVAKSASYFGFKSLLMGILMNETKYKKASIAELTTGLENENESELNDFHVILLDNGRKNLMGSKLEEFLQCIHCNGCGAVCPRSILGYGEEYRIPRDLILLHLTKGLKETVDHGLYNCTLCGGCKIECPLSIPLPEFLQEIRAQAVKNDLVPKKHLNLCENVKNFGNPYGRGE